ncbi:MAG TPA: class I SAM-dependent methyltransferase [Kofleriaceae bacterium]|nr:class I SAM-dependent methyltransferase [Kofleriaceae bacterium]
MFNAKKFKQKQRVAWNAMADVYDHSFSTLAYPATMQMILEAKLQPGDFVLDLASGTGADAFTAAPFIGDTGKIIGIDIAENMVATANQKAKARGVANCEFQVMDGEELTFKSGMFDVAVSKWGLMYFPDCHKALKEVLRVLKPGGRLSALVLGRQERARFMTVGALAAYKINPTLIAADDGPSAFQFGPDGAVEALLNAAGFDNIRSRRFALMISCSDGEKYWEMLTNGVGNFSDKLRRAEPGVMESVRRLAIEQAEKYNSPDGIRLPLEVVCAYAEKPAKGRDAVVVPTRLKSIDEVADGIRQIAPAAAAALLREPHVAFVDVRSSAACAGSRIPRAHGVPRGDLEGKIGEVLALESLRQVVVYSDDGALGRLAAKTLTEMGYPGVVNLDGGFDAWRAQGLPVDDQPRSNSDVNS